jgi:transcriptional regulator with XRE-family HTH domain
MTEIQTAITQRTKALGTLIRDAREASGRSIEECAEATSISPEAMRRYEAGEQAPSLPELEGLAYYLDVPLDRFWETKTTSGPVSKRISKHSEHMALLISLRHRMIGALIRQARLESGVSPENLARWSEIDPATLETYELGQLPIPVPQLEVLSGFLSRSIREFYDRHGPVGAWSTQQHALQEFTSMPAEMQEFISKPINRPYLELAMRLSEMSVDRLRSVAEGLLEITY